MLSELWRIRLLGELSAAQADRTVTRFRTHKTAELLAYLAFYAGRAHPRERLMDLLWPDSSLDSARMSLSVALSSLRSVLEPPATAGTPTIGGILVADRSTVRLHSEAFTSDVADFEAALAAAGKAGADAEDVALEYLATADALYRGDLLPGVDSEWVLVERERLADAQRGVLRRLALLQLNRRDIDEALTYARRAVQADSLDEAARRVLMRALAAAGRPAAAVEQFRDLERVLDEAGEDPPSPTTRELAERLDDGGDKGVASVSVPSPSPKEEPSDAPPIPSPAPRIGQSPLGRLPTPLTRFFGREEEMAALAAAFVSGSQRVLTLTGIGGAGKTRLAIEAATRLATDRTVAEAFFVPLADVTESARLFETIRDALRLPRTPPRDPLEQIAEHLSAQPGSVLIVLDNLEQLLGHGPFDPAGAATAVRALLARVSSLLLLITSREALGLEGETVLSVAPLPTPPDPKAAPADLLTFPSVRLFADRAANRRVDFQVSPRNAESVARLCTRLEGIPLALELAAARAKLMSPAQMLERLEEGFAEVQSLRPDIPERHRSLHAAIAWSYELLSPGARKLFAGLSVFRGGCTVEATVAICGTDIEEGTVLEILARLRDASLIFTEDARSGSGADTVRLRLLEPLREFASRQLTSEERDCLERRHAEYFLTFATETALALRGGAPQDELLDRLEADLDNLRAVMARYGDTEIGLRLAGQFWQLWTVRGHKSEGREWLRAALAADDARGAAPTAARARALHLFTSLVSDTGEYDLAVEYGSKAVAVYGVLGDRRSEGAMLLLLGNVAYRRADYPSAREKYERALAIMRAEQLPLETSLLLSSLGNLCWVTGDTAGARRLHQECLRMAREHGSRHVVANMLHNLGLDELEDENLAEAYACFEEGLSVSKAIGYHRGCASHLWGLGEVALRYGDREIARRNLVEALRLAHENDSPTDIDDCLRSLAWWAALGGRTKVAAQLWGAAEARRTAIQLPIPPPEKARLDTRVREARQASPSPQGFDAAWRAGAALSLEDAARLVSEDPV